MMEIQHQPWHQNQPLPVLHHVQSRERPLSLVVWIPTKGAMIPVNKGKITEDQVRIQPWMQAVEYQHPLFSIHLHLQSCVVALIQQAILASKL